MCVCEEPTEKCTMHYYVHVPAVVPVPNRLLLLLVLVGRLLGRLVLVRSGGSGGALLV